MFLSVKDAADRLIELRAGNLKNSTSGFLAAVWLESELELANCLLFISTLFLRS